MKRKFAAVTVLAIIGSFLGCPHGTDVSPMPPTVSDQDQCAPACANLQKLGCEVGKPIDMKKACAVDVDCDSNQTCAAGRCVVSCERFCRDTENVGVWLSPECVSHITSCDQVENCPAPVRK